MKNGADDGPALADREWRGYDPRAAVPAAVVAAAASAVILVGRWRLKELSDLADRAGALVVFALAAAVWPGLALVFVYRAVTYTYRLTDRAVLVDRGPLHRPVPPLWLHELTGVEAGSGPVGRLLGVGWVRLRAGGRAVRLGGVRDPHAFAAAVRSEMAKSHR